MRVRYLWFCLVLAAIPGFTSTLPVLRLNGGGSDYAQTPHTALLASTAQMTMEAWVNPTQWRSYSGREQYGLGMFFKGLLGSHIDYSFKLERNGWVCYGTTREGAWLRRPAVPLNQWTHMAVTFNTAAHRLTLYINGVRIADFDSGAMSSYIQPAGYPLYIGGFYQPYAYNNNNFIGSMADVRVWNVERSAAEIAGSMGSTLQGNEPGLVAYWNFSQVNGRTVPDLSGHGHTLTLNGSTSIQQASLPISDNRLLQATLTQPANGAQYAAPADIPISATVSNNSTGLVTRVEFYSGATKIGEDLTAPYGMIWTNVSGGSYTITARAIAQGGITANSAAAVVRVFGPFGGAPVAVPGALEAENFDLGGQGLGYNDTTAANEGGQYRPADGVDISADSHAGNGYVVGWTKAGEWLSYIVNVASNGSYSIQALVAAHGNGGQFRILVNGVDKTGVLNVPNTGSWDNYQIVQKSNVELSSGIQTVRVAMVANGTSDFVGAFDTFTIGEALPPFRAPYNPSKKPWPVPGPIEFEDFDLGGPDVTYHDVTEPNEGKKYRDEPVDIGDDPKAGNGHVVGWTKAGEWMEYTVAPTPGTYSIEARVAGVGNGGRIRFELDGEDVTGPLDVPDAGAWDAYRIISAPDVFFGMGVHTVRVVMVANGAANYAGALDWFRMVEGSGGPVQTPNDGTPVDLPGVVQAESFDAGGQGLAYSDTTPANEGGQYRVLEAVDIAAHAGASNGFVVGWTKAGEWMEYAVNVTAAGQYNMLARLGALGTGGRFRVELAGTTADVIVPNTGGWYAYQNVAVNEMELASGIHTMRVSMVQNGTGGSVAAFDQFAFLPSAQSAYPAGVPWPMPGTVQVEDFDQGGAGIAYQDSTPANLGGGYRLADGVDITAAAGAGNGFVVGWTPPEEWMEYTVNVADSGTYTLETRVAGVGVGGQFRILVNGEDKTGLLNVPNTGAWNTYQIVQKTGVVLSAGTQQIRLVMVTAGPSGHAGAFDYIRVVAPAELAAGRSSSLEANSPLPVDVRSSQEDQQPMAGWLAADGDDQTAWQGMPGAGGWWLTLAYDPQIALNGVTIDWTPDSPTNVQYLYSMDADEWTKLELPLTNGPVAVNYLWLVFPDAGSNHPPAIREIHVQ